MTSKCTAGSGGEARAASGSVGAMQANGASMQAAYAAVKSEADYQKRKTVDSQPLRGQPRRHAGAGPF